MHDGRDFAGGSLLDEAQIELHDLGSKERHEGERGGVGANVVERHRPPACANPLDRAQQLGGPRGDRALGDLKHDAEFARSRIRDAQQVIEWRSVENLGLHVDEQRERSQVVGRDSAPKGLGAALCIQLRQTTRGAGGCEQRNRRFKRAPDWATRERLVADNGGSIDVDDRLERHAQATLRDHLPPLVS